MDPKKVIMGKRLLLVDDEKDILEILVALLELCKIDTASSFDEARELLQKVTYDVVVLDIMGVNGFDLLDIANKRNVPALMLTAHSLNEESLMKSVRQGAAYFVPKDKITEIATYVADVIEARENSKDPWTRWFERLGNYFDVFFTGDAWREQRNEFEEKLKRTAQ
ncbi:MAG: response regulator [Desulfobacteraceae bacterium]|nr:MAG: response regulator [Desulfobacteraceae bacterium]